MLVVTAFAMALMSGQEPVVIGNASGNRPRVADRAAAADQGNGSARPAEEVCRNVSVTGSRFPRRVCTNRQQAMSEREEGRAMLRRMQGSRTPDGG